MDCDLLVCRYLLYIMCCSCQLIQISSNRSWVPTQGVLHINVPFAGKFEEREVLVKFLRQEVFRHNILLNLDVFVWYIGSKYCNHMQPINLFMPANCMVDDPGWYISIYPSLIGWSVNGLVVNYPTEWISTYKICQNGKPSSLIIIRTHH